MQRPAKPCTAVRFRPQPPSLCYLWPLMAKESIESAKQMGITAQGYIDSMEATQKALSNCVIELFNMTRPPEVELGKIQGLVKTMGLDKLLDQAESK